MFDRIAAATTWIWIAGMFLGLLGLAGYLAWDMGATLIRSLLG